MATHIGKGHIHGLSGGAYDDAVLTVVPNMQSLDVSHSVEVDRIKGMDGETNAVIFSDQVLEMNIDAIPQGATVANAKTSATLPAAPSALTLSGFPVIPIGPHADAINGVWIYEGGGSINGANAKWSMRLPLRRYVGITSATAIT